MGILVVCPIFCTSFVVTVAGYIGRVSYTVYLVRLVALIVVPRRIGNRFEVAIMSVNSSTI